MGLDGRHADPGDRRRHRLHRLVHEQPHRGPACRGRRRATAGTSHRACGPSSCPGSWAVKAPGRGRGPRRVFTAAGFDWREPGCSMCLAMNPDKLAPGERCARRRIATSRAARAEAAAPTSSPPPSPPPPPSPATSPPRRISLMEAVRIVTGHGRAARPQSDVDTDQIIPSDWLKRVERTGFEKGLFSEVARRPALRPQRRAVTPAPPILVAGPNFGTGLVARARRLGASSTTASTPSSRPGSATSSATTRPRTASCPSCVDRRRRRALLAAIEADPTSSSTIDVERRTWRRRPSAHRRASRSTTPSAAPLPRGPRRHRHHAAARGEITTYESSRPAWLQAQASGR